MGEDRVELAGADRKSAARRRAMGSRVRAFLVVTALAVGAGAALGALTIGAFLLAAIVGGRGLTSRDAVGLFALGAGWGAAFGVALGPLTAFGLLRAVPLWKSILWTALGATAGVIATFGAGAHPFVAIPLGFLGGALCARFSHAPASFKERSAHDANHT